MQGWEGRGGRFRIGKNILGGFGHAIKFSGLKHMALEDEVLGGAVHLNSNIACNFCGHPYFSVSQSEAGFEKIMQAVTLQLTWQMHGKLDELDITLEVN